MPINKASARKVRKTSKPWHLVTNQQNMLYMLAAGMVTAPSGFGGKHYADVLDLEPGSIPLFRHTVKIPESALALATSERKFLTPCVASFHLDGMSGPVRILSPDGKQRNVAKLPVRKGKTELAAFIQAPLPMHLLSSISFRTPEDKQAIEAAAADVANVDLSCIDLRVDESMFDGDTATTLPKPQPQGQLIQSSTTVQHALGQALGGALAMLYHAANRSDLGVTTFRRATTMEPEHDANDRSDDPIMAQLPEWFVDGCIPQSSDPRARLYWGVIKTIIDDRNLGNKQPPIEIAIQYLESQRASLEGDKFESRLVGLISDMRGCLGFGGGTITELFERHKGSLSRPLLLFCLRHDCTDLLGFSHPLLNDAEYILAAVLFGVRDGWLRLPRDLREPELSAYVAHRMASVEHVQHGTGVTYQAPPRPEPLRQWFMPASAPFTGMQTDAALQLARRCHWHDCIYTRITLGEGDHPEQFIRAGQELVLPGEVTATPEVDKTALLDRIGRWPPPAQDVTRQLRERLGDVGSKP